MVWIKLGAALAALCVITATTSAQTHKLNSWALDSKGRGRDSCALASSEDELATNLRRHGIDSTQVPRLNWSRSEAIIISPAVQHPDSTAKAEKAGFSDDTL